MVPENGFVLCLLEGVSIIAVSIAAFLLARHAFLHLQASTHVQRYVVGRAGNMVQAGACTLQSAQGSTAQSGTSTAQSAQGGVAYQNSLTAQIMSALAPLRVVPFSYVASALIKRKSCGNVCRFVYRLHPALHCFTCAETMLAWLCAAPFAAGVIALVLSGQWSSAVITVCAASAGIYFALKHAYDSALRRQREAIPQVLELMSDSFSCGFTLLQTFESVCASDNCLVKDVFKRALNVLRLSGDTSRALDVLKSSRLGNHMAFVAVALQIQHMCGGSSHGVVQAAMKSAQNELELARKLSTQTAQAHLSARIVCALPLVLLALFSVISPGFLDAYFKSITGILIFCTALGMQALGMFLVHRILQIPELR